MPIVTATASPVGPLLDVLVHVTVQLLGQLNASGRAIPSPIQVRGLIDTGASGTCLDSSIIARLGLVPIGSTPVHTPSTAGQAQLRYLYDVGLWLPSRGKSAPYNIRTSLPVIETDLTGQGIELLIGRNVLESCLMVFDGPANTIRLAFP
jgi:hypothetical protein